MRNDCFGVYIGTVEAVYPPNHKLNVSRYQYEYKVLVTLDGSFSQIPVNNCIRSDANGFLDNYEDQLLLPSSVVLVAFPNGSTSYAVILGAIRNHTSPAPVIADSQQQWKKRYNRFELTVDKDYNFTAKSDSGPFAQVKVDKVILDDSVGEQVILDKANKTLTLNCKEFVVNVKGNANIVIDNDANITIKKNATIKVNENANITVDKNVTLKCKNLEATVQEAAKIKCKELTADVSGSAKIKCKELSAEAALTAKIKALSISLNGSSGAILTDTLNPLIDLITGVPSIGVPTVRSG